MAGSVDSIKVKYEVDIAKFQQQLRGLEAQMTSLESKTKKSAQAGEDAFKKEDGIINRLRSNIQKLAEARDKSNNPNLINLYNKKLDEANGKLKKLTSTQEQAGKSVNTFQASLKSLLPALTVAFAVERIIAFGSAIVTSTMKFEKSLSSLSSLTGATGKDLQFFADQAKQIGLSTTIGAEEAVKAFELIGSAKPELLASKEALAQVTKEAIALAEASGLDLPAAAQALVGALNQFNLPAEESARIINTLAAGSLAGAAAIPDIAAALDRFGTVANDANVSVEQSVALVETLADKNIKGAEAGTQLRNIILKLQAANIGYKDGVFDLTLALEEVKNRNLSAADAAKLFGLESITAGNILVNNVDRYKSLTTAVTGTQTAYDQAKINTANLDSQLKKLNNTFEVAQLEIGNNFTPVLSGAAEGANDLLQAFMGTSKESSILTKAVDGIKLAFGFLFAPVKEFFNVLESLYTDILKPVSDFISAIFVPIIESFQKAFGGAGDGATSLVGKLNPLIIALKLALLPLKLIAAALGLLTPIITDFIVPAFQDFTIFLAKARNEVADFVNAIIDSGFAKKVTSTFGFEVAKIGKVNIDELTKSFDKNSKSNDNATKSAEEHTKKLKEEADKVKELTEIEKENIKQREEARKKEISDFVKMKNRPQVADLDLHAKTEIDKTKISKEQEAKRQKGWKASTGAFKKKAEEEKAILDAAAKKKEDDDLEEALRIEDNKKAAVDAAFEATNMILDAVQDAQQRKTDAELLQSETQTENELKALEKRKENGTITEEQFQKRKETILAAGKKREGEIKTKDAQNDKKLALFRIALDTATAIVKGAAAAAPPVNIPLIAIQAALGAIQFGIVASTPIPKFAKGVTRFKGKGTNTSDSNLALLSNNESVVTAKASIENEDAITAMNKGDYKKYIFRNDVLPALKKAQKIRQQEDMNFANNISNMVKLMKDKDGFDDYKIVRQLKNNKTVGLDENSISQIGKVLSKRSSEDRSI